jgi:hypothetical protein
MIRKQGHFVAFEGIAPTMMRTRAASGVTTEYLARKGAKTDALFWTRRSFDPSFDGVVQVMLPILEQVLGKKGVDESLQPKNDLLRRRGLGIEVVSMAKRRLS